MNEELKDIEFKCPHCGEVITLKIMKKLLEEKPEPPRKEWDEDLIKLRLNSPDSDD